MVNPKNLPSEKVEEIMNKGYDLKDIMKMSWAKVDKVLKEE